MSQPSLRRSPRSILLMLASLLLSLAVDLGSKEWALQHLSSARTGAAALEVCEVDAQGHSGAARIASAPRPLIHGVLRLSYAENCGAAFSVLRTAPRALRLSVFMGLSLAATVVLLGMFVRGAGGPLFAVGVPLIVSGAIGNNLWDRPRHGFVVDFLQVDPALFHYPVFNIADVWIAVGVGLLLLDSRPRAVRGASSPVPAELSR